MTAQRKNLWQSELTGAALRGSFVKLNPVTLWRSPVMLVVELGALTTTVITIVDSVAGGKFWFDFQISLWLWFTVLFANFAEALAEGRGKAQAETLRRTRSETHGTKVFPDGHVEQVPALMLGKGDIVVVDAGELVPGDGEIVQGVALVDESAITGESAPVVREAGGDRSGITGGTKILSGRITARISTDPGDTFLDHMVAMVESAKRQKTPNEIALEILLVGLTILFLVVVLALPVFASYIHVSISISVLVALLVCLMPTTIGGLLPAIGIAGMDRLLRKNVISLSGRAVEAAGDVDVVLLDKTGTITLGSRMATDFIPADGVSGEELAEAALFSSLADETPEGRSIVVLAKQKVGIRSQDIHPPENAVFIPFSVETRMSGINWDVREIRKGAADAVEEFARSRGGEVSGRVTRTADNIALEGETPLLVADGKRVLGIIRLKDVLKQNIPERIARLRGLGIQSVMITGDNSITAASIAAEAGLDDFFAQAKPETKLGLIRKYQEMGHLVAMIGDGTNDAPALAQADVAVAMNAGTQVAREAANMIDLDSTPTKLLDIVEIGKQILITRGALTTFSIANDVAKYFAIIPAVFVVQYPRLNVLNVMHLATPASAVLAAVIFNAIIIPMLIPLALHGVSYRPSSAVSLLKRNMFIYGFGGLALPFLGIKLLDMIIVAFKHIP
ncbi:MAG: potassium-transporting ATPase subunit KdpB [Candidatus Ratteibacteria bacterium]|jgi:K+-transporting ATPase ATPase B chain